MTLSPTRIAAGVVLREPKIIEERCPWCFGAGLIADPEAKSAPRLLTCKPCAGLGHVVVEAYQ